MADLKISQLTGATTPLAGTEVLPIVQSSSTKKVATDDLTVKNVRSNATTGIMQIVGPAASTTRVMTIPNANFTAARTDAGQTFTGNQIIDGTFRTRTSSGNFTGIDVDYGGVDNPIVNFNMNDGSWRYRFNMNSDTDIKFQTNVGGSPYTAWQVDRTTLNITFNTGNLVQGTAAKGINFTANTPAAGMTSQLLNWYEEGTWTPNQGAGLTLVGAFSSAGTYTRIGRQVFIRGSVSGATSVAVASAGAITTNLPYSAAADATGTAINAANDASSILRVSSATLTAATAIAATTTITFSAVYSV